MKLAAICPALLAALLAGCVAGPDYAGPGTTPAGEGFLRSGESSSAIADARWWTVLGDGELDRLVERALGHAPAIAAAEARVRQARAGLAASRASLLPSLGTSALYVYADLPNNAFGSGGGANEFYSLGFDAQWEADLWGGKRRDVEKARAQAGAAEAALADAHVQLSAEVARSYVVLRARAASLALLQERRDAEQRLSGLMEQRLKGGTGTRQELAMARQRQARTEGEVAAMLAEIASLRDALAVLTGDVPGSLDSMPGGPVPLPPAEVHVGDPAALLARRPDVMVAERRLAAATAGIGIAEARKFPSISLMGLIGIGGTNIDDVLDTSQAATLALPRLSWSFLDFGRNAAAVDAAEAGRDEAQANWQASVLEALRDAEASLARFGAARVAYARSMQVAGEGAQIARLQDMRAKAGAAAPAEAIDARIGAIDAQLAETNDRAALTLAYVSVAKALGLGWQAAGD